jgi:hypothetical protein
VLDYSIHLPANESKTSVVMIADLLHQIEYMFNWNEAFATDVELTFVLSARDQCNLTLTGVRRRLHMSLISSS